MTNHRVNSNSRSIEVTWSSSRNHTESNWLLSFSIYTQNWLRNRWNRRHTTVSREKYMS